MTTTLKLKKRPVAPLLILPLLLSSTLITSAQVHAAPSPESATEVAGINAGFDNASLSDISAQIGREIVQQLVNARKALALGNRDTARSNLLAARKLNASVLRTMPFAVLNEEIINAKGKLVLGETKMFYHQLLPIYAELDQLAIYAPDSALKAKLHLRKAEGLAHKNNSKASIAKLDEVIVAVSETGIYLPVIYVSRQIKAALHDLSQPESDGRTALQAVDNAIESLTQYSEEVVITPDP